MARPLIATDVAGCRHVVEDGVNGFLCAVRDPASLAEKMLKLIRMPAGERSKLGAAGRARVERDYGESGAVEPYLQVLDEIFARRR